LRAGSGELTAIQTLQEIANPPAEAEYEFDRTDLPDENDTMLLVLLALIVFAFLFLGSIVFLACIVLPPTRRYALSTAFWFAVWGPCSVVLMMIAGLGLVAGALVMKTGSMQLTDAPKLLAAFGWSYVMVGALITTTVATGAAWFHQMLIHRFTFALFRLYATVISAGIGSVLGWSLGWWIVAKGITHPGLWWVLEMVILIAGFGIAAYKGARGLRGKMPTKFTWISPEEFAGSHKP
jgi:hypothetical protein